MKIITIAGFALALAGAPITAQAHAFLDHAAPGVGATVNVSPSELELTFTQDVVAALSGVRVATMAGAPVGTAKPVGRGSTLHVRLSGPLAAGTYVVTWHVVSIDTHPTSGHYRFTVGP